MSHCRACVGAVECHALVHPTTTGHPAVLVNASKGTAQRGLDGLPNYPARITCRKFLILQCQPEPHSLAHKQKFLMRSDNRRSSSYSLPLTKGGNKNPAWVPQTGTLMRPA